MKAIFTQTGKSHLHTIDFSVELPLIIAECTGSSFGRGNIISRGQDLYEIVDEMAEINVGRFHQETINAAPVYYDYLSDLVFTEGLEFVHRSGRYQMQVVIGLCFDSERVCQKIATIVRRHFYPEHPLSTESRIKFDPAKSEDANVHV